MTDSGRGPSEEGSDGRTTTTTTVATPRDRYLPPPPPPPRVGAYWAAQQQPVTHRAAHQTARSQQSSHPTVRFHGLSTMPEEDGEDVVRAGAPDAVSSTKVSPAGRQVGRRAVGGRHGPVGGRPAQHSSRAYNASAPPAYAATQRRPDDASAYLLLDTADGCPLTGSSLQRQHAPASEPSTATHANDDQRSLLQNGFVTDRERIYHDNSVIV